MGGEWVNLLNPHYHNNTENSDTMFNFRFLG